MPVRIELASFNLYRKVSQTRIYLSLVSSQSKMSQS